MYLVDYGLATKYMTGSGEHKEYKENPKKAHDGTIEFTSTDAHKGVCKFLFSILMLGSYPNIIISCLSN